MKDYELTVLFHPDLEMNFDPALDKLRKLIETRGGKITKEEADGKKRLSYDLAGQSYAIYHYFELTLPADAPAKLSSTLNITDEVIRHMLVRADERKRAQLEAAEEDKSAKSTKSTEEKGE